MLSLVLSSYQSKLRKQKKTENRKKSLPFHASLHVLARDWNMDFLAIRVYQYLLYVKLGDIHLVFFMHIFRSELGINSDMMDSINIFLIQISL